MNKVDRYLDNLSNEALKQMIKFLLEPSVINKEFVLQQIDEFHIMYPEDC